MYYNGGMSIGPCLCGDTACPSCHPGGKPPEECPICGAPNYDEDTDALVDSEYATCGKEDCIAKEQQRLIGEAEAEQLLECTEQARLAEHAKTCTACKDFASALQHEWETHLAELDRTA
jgi:hypothetical protein